ncbi:MAG: hypothetical protein DUD27_08495 [Lachnospiraceae bacterium]|uniref:AAA-ATPase-like domain-containing protein n=1 Tax=Candidatus Weimeria bifida TaxID=2599074 RepID=A0A6N7J0J7_9FIRM|nr:hypothetical protein [Candidatus Weimeria bifida]RRF95043.1 MAG: hypothetical protein DUD27_08495 [Lachnospiraceae bacterium]
MERRQNGYVYVDKTRYVWELARTRLSYFLSRPRRFGMSLNSSWTNQSKMLCRR